jgi:DNA primase
MNPDAKAKYLNSPETELFKKSNVLYNFKRARNHIHTSNEVIVAEGYMDVIALHAAGFRNAVAPLGTALTDSHLDTLWKVCEKPTLCFDGDSAGQRAASRAVELALPKIHDGKTLRFLGLPDGMDPDDFLKEFGSNKFKQIFNGAIPLHEMILERRLDSVVLDTPEQKAKFEKDVMADVALIKDPAVLKYYRSHQRMRLYELFGTLRNSNRQQDNNRRAAISKEIASIPQNSLVRMLLGLCVEYPGVVQEFIEEIVNISFDNNVYHTFVGQLYKLYVEYENLNVATIYEKLDDDLRFVLESVHGEASTSTTMIKNGQERFEHFTKRGHKLRLLFPAIKVEPPATTIRDFVIMVIEQLHHRIAKNELEIIKQSPDMNPESIYELAMSLQEQEARLSKIEREIDEQFQSLRRTGLDAMYVAA